jgi:predicted nucleic acid-binding protein
MHPMVLGELACGNLRAREKLMNLWHNLPALAPATDAEALYFLDLNRLWGRGIGYVDLHLLTASALAPGTLLWTRDKRLADVAAGLNLAYFE